MEPADRLTRGVRLRRSALLVAAVAVMAACDAVTGTQQADDGGIYVRYVGSEAGVYDTYCFPVRDEPEGRIVEIERIEDVNIIDATYEYLPDGLKIQDPVSPVRYADCRDYDLEQAPPPTPAPSTTTLPPTTVAPATVPATVPPAAPLPTVIPPLPTLVPPPTVVPPPPTTPPSTTAAMPSTGFGTVAPSTTVAS